MDFNTLLTALVTNGVGGVCAAAVLWFAYYRETRTIPELMRTFTDAQTVVISSFEGRNDKIMETFATVMREERSVCQKWHEENRQGLTQLLAEMKDQRHLIRDLAHQAGLQKAVEAMMKKRHEEGKDDSSHG